MLPPFNNTPYIKIVAGDSLGVIDIIGSIHSLHHHDHHHHGHEGEHEHDCDFSDPSNWYNKKHKLARQFSVMATETSEL